jgi:hypothetical protein
MVAGEGTELTIRAMAGWAGGSENSVAASIPELDLGSAGVSASCWSRLPDVLLSPSSCCVCCRIGIGWCGSEGS